MVIRAEFRQKNVSTAGTYLYMPFESLERVQKYIDSESNCYWSNLRRLEGGICVIKVSFSTWQRVKWEIATLLTAVHRIFADATSKQLY